MLAISALRLFAAVAGACDRMRRPVPIGVACRLSFQILRPFVEALNRVQGPSMS
jgi:hypothetical protein